MAFVRNYSPDDEENQQNQQAQPIVSPTLIREGTTTTGVASNTSRNGIRPTNMQSQGSGQFANLQRYLDANRGGAGVIAGQVAGDINQQVTEAQSKSQEAQSAFGQQIDQGTLKYNSGLVGQAAADASAYLGNQDLQKMLSGQYAGPTQYLGTEGDTAAQKEILEARERGMMADNSAGLNYLLKNTAGAQGRGITTGGASLNQFILRNTEPAWQQVKQASAAAKPLGDTYIDQVKQIQERVKQAQTASQGVRNQTIEGLGAGVGQIQNQVNQQVQQQQQQANQAADATQYAAAIRAAAQGNMPDAATLGRLGLTSDIVKNIVNTMKQAQSVGGAGVDLAAYLTPGQAAQIGSRDAVTQAQLEDLAALQSLTGRDTQNWLQAGRAGRGPGLDYASAMGELQGQYQTGQQQRYLAELQRQQQEQAARLQAQQQAAAAEQARQQQLYMQQLAQQQAAAEQARQAQLAEMARQQAAQQAAYQQYLEQLAQQQAAERAAQEAAYKKWLEDMLAAQQGGQAGGGGGGSTGGGTTTPPPGLGENYAPPLPQRRPDEPDLLPPELATDGGRGVIGGQRPNPEPEPVTPPVSGGGGGGGDSGFVGDGGGWGNGYDGSGDGSIYIPDGVPVYDDWSRPPRETDEPITPEQQAELDRIKDYYDVPEDTPWADKIDDVTDWTKWLPGPLGKLSNLANLSANAYRKYIENKNRITEEEWARIGKENEKVAEDWMKEVELKEMNERYEQDPWGNLDDAIGEQDIPMEEYTPEQQDDIWEQEDQDMQEDPADWWDEYAPEEEEETPEEDWPDDYSEDDYWFDEDIDSSNWLWDWEQS